MEIENPAAAENPPEVSRVVEHLFRHEAGKMVATLTGIFGIEHLTLAEDVVQEALARASQTWPFYGVPKNPAACHCAAKDYASTDWPQILSLYDHLVEFDDSPVVALNRAVALAEVRGPQAGIEAVNTIQNLQTLESYYLLHAVLGEFESRLNHARAAAGHFRKSLQLAEIKSEQAFLAKRLRACEDQGRV